MKRIAHLATALSLFALVPAVSHAQSSNGVHFNIAAGLSLPTGDLGRVTDAGYALVVGLGMRQPASQLGFRLEGSYDEWAFSSPFNGKTHAGGVSANATYDFTSNTTRRGTATGNTLYGIGGLGVFGVGNGSSNFGWNLGGGFKFPLSGFSAYLEARYHYINVSSGNYSYVPIVFGLEF